MKRHRTHYDQCRTKKHREKQRKNESGAGGFVCQHCKQFVVINALIGTANRNHCNMCLWSRHVDEAKGDRRATCLAGMKPIGLTFKHDGYGRQGEIMLIHLCSSCAKISINRIARDDDEQRLLAIFEQSFVTDSATKKRLQNGDIYMLGTHDRQAVHAQLFGCP